MSAWATDIQAEEVRPVRWQLTLWREWRHTQNRAFADSLFDLIGNKPLGPWMSLVFVLLCAIVGAMLAFFAAMVLTRWGKVQFIWGEYVFSPPLWDTALSDQENTISFLWPSLLGAALASALCGIGIRWHWKQKWSWRRWLTRCPLCVAQAALWGGIMFGVALLAAAAEQFVGVRWVIVGVFIIVILAFFHDDPDVGGIGLFFFVMLVGLGLLLIYLIRLLGGGIFGIVGLGFVSALMGTGVAFWLPVERTPFEYRGWCKWWLERPHVFAVAQALRQACEEQVAVRDVWEMPLQKLTARKENPRSPELLIKALSTTNGPERFLTEYELVSLGGQAVRKLEAHVNDANIKATVHHLLRSIGQDTCRRLARRSRQLLCPTCLVGCHRYEARLTSLENVTYYCCRACRHSQEFRERPREIVAVLDDTMVVPTTESNGILRVNWQMRQDRPLFDFDRVEIGEVAEEEVERFLTLVGNDNDDWRASRYRNTRCDIDPHSNIGNALRNALKNRFGGGKK